MHLIVNCIGRHNNGIEKRRAFVSSLEEPIVSRSEWATNSTVVAE